MAGTYRPSRPPSVFARRLGRARSGTEGVLDELRGVILSGEAAPGVPIPLDEIAQALGVSQIPVREALKTLIGEGLVDHRPRGGYTVARITVAELAELYVVRGTLEQAALAAALPLASAADHAEARTAHEALDDALARGDMAAYHRASRRFHLALVAPARMHRLQRMLESAWNITEPYRPMSQLSDAGRAGLHADHAAMLAAFVSGDAEALLREAIEHHEDLRRAVAALPSDPALFADP
ncbi:GntR family transcriptional regulator [Pseudonocardia sp. WMMC193]|uniref:GntR family transcriptional regulator n=1 Tax=Pseudonocardia sp. WMMC193 TaxID=2911965 RepID=UPI001F269EF0|nr:GntR family transcriptional regulator [Pseudonocardia sp. WMMC193]MCF7550417.1 GntR family transcriptional regulator [Pseudonocardia sp. WMMC193]